jgi:transposase
MSNKASLRKIKIKIKRNLKMPTLKLRKIKPTEKKKIAYLLRCKIDSRLALRLRIVDLANRGYWNPKIANLLKLNSRTVRKWIGRFNDHGIGGLNDLPRSGRPPISESIKSKVLEIVGKDPRELKEAFSSWTLETIQKKLLELEAIKISPASISKIIRKAGWKYRTPRCLYQTDAPREAEKYQRLVEISKEILESGSLPYNHVVLSVDESHWNLKPLNTKVWTPPNIKQIHCDIPNNKFDSFTTFAAMNVYNGHVLYKVTCWGYAFYFKQFLHQIRSYYKDKTIHLILDNASIHTAYEIEEFREKYPCFRFHFLLARGSEVNPIERFWKYAKDKVKKGRSFKKVTELYSAIRKFFRRYQCKDYRYTPRQTLEKICLRSWA